MKNHVNKTYIYIILALFSCGDRKQGTALVQSKGLGLPNGKVYLKTKGLDVVDSAEVVSGDFQFRLEPARRFLASITFVEKNAGHKRHLTFRNYTASEKPSFFGSLMVGEDSITITRSGNDAYKGNSIDCEINQTYENDILFKYGFSAPLSIGIIKQFNQSHYLMGRLYDSRFSYKEKDLGKIFDLFSLEAKESDKGLLLQSYLDHVLEDNQSSSIDAYDAKFRLRVGVNKTKKLNMVVFWASWCKPCKEEVPIIDSIFRKYQHKDLSISHVSIDKEEKNWVALLEKFDTPWPQYLIPQKELHRVESRYKISAIPLVIFFDHKGNMVKRFDDGNHTRYGDFIERYLDRTIAVSSAAPRACAWYTSTMGRMCLSITSGS